MTEPADTGGHAPHPSDHQREHAERRRARRLRGARPGGPAAQGAGGAAASGPAASGPDTSGWTVLHSFDIADHRRQLAGEIDFLCIVPGKGVLVVEVKGCHQLARHDGDWYYGHNAEPDHRGPFRQAADAMHSLRQRLAKLHPELAGVPFWSAACFPFIDFTESSPEWHSLAGHRPPRAAVAADRAAHRGRPRPGAQAPRRAPRRLVPSREGRADAAPVRRAGRSAAPGLRLLREPQVPPAAAGRGGPPLHGGAVRGAGHHRHQPAHRLRRAGRHRQDAAGHRGRAPRRLARPPRPAPVLQPAARPLAAGGDGRHGARRHGAHPARAPARPGRHRAHARAALPHRVLAGRAAVAGRRGAARA